MNHFNKTRRVVLIDCSKAFRSTMHDFAESRGINLTCYESVMSMGSVGNFGAFDIAIVECDRGGLSGVEVGEYLSALFTGMPLILISDGLRPNGKTTSVWPDSIKGFVHKHDGADAILDAALDECA
jgi:DNA-binding NtrC family response regulator